MKRLCSTFSTPPDKRSSRPCKTSGCVTEKASCWYTTFNYISVIHHASPTGRLLLVEYVAGSATGHSIENAIERKDKRKLPAPFCCWRYRPTKPYFMHSVKWSVLQYVIIQPAITIAGMICESYNVLCVTGPYSVYYANVYLQVIGVISSLIATYGLLLFHGLTEEELKGRRSWAKSLTIDLITAFVFFQSFIIDALEGRVIKATQYWTETNVADGLNALVICVEMVPFSLMALWAYTWKEYVIEGAPKTSIWRPLWDSINYMDFAIEIGRAFKFYYDCVRVKPYTRSTARLEGRWINDFQTMGFDQAFGIERTSEQTANASIDEGIQLPPADLQKGGYSAKVESV